MTGTRAFVASFKTSPPAAMASALDRSSPVPLWAQLVEDLYCRLVSGEFDQRFPSDDELTRHYGVSRQTAREAVRHLAQEGLVVRHRGRGSALAQPMLERPLRPLYSFTSTCRSGDLAERHEVLAAERRRPTADVAKQLEVDLDQDVIVVERLGFASAEPIAWDRCWLRGDLAGALLGVDLTRGGLYDLLATHCSIRVTGGWERIRPTLPGPAECRLLRLPAGTATFLVERRTFCGGIPIEWRSSLIRGDRYALVARWPAAVRPQPRGTD